MNKEDMAVQLEKTPEGKAEYHPHPDTGSGSGSVLPRFIEDCEKVRALALDILGISYDHAGNDVTEYSEYKLKIDAAQILLNASGAIESWQTQDAQRRFHEANVLAQARRQEQMIEAAKTGLLVPQGFGGPLQ
jgi:hypothetical protein